jgi:hypothetical protein
MESDRPDRERRRIHGDLRAGDARATARVGDIYGYGIFLCAGAFAWGLFVEIVQRGAGMFIEHGNLLKKASFPKSEPSGHRRSFGAR